MSYLYLIPILIAIIIGIFYLLINELDKKKMIDKPFLNEFSNEIYTLSYSAPFKYFISKDEDSVKIKEIKRTITESNMSHLLNYRVYTTIQTLIFATSMLLFLFFLLIADNSDLIIKSLFNIKIDISNPQSLIKIKVIAGMFFLALCLVPSVYLKKKAKKNKYFFLKDLPILQLFVILMLKANRPLGEVLYVLSNTNTIYKPIFSISYRMYVGDRREGIECLRVSFEGTKFEDTVRVLSEYGEYSKKESLSILENNLKDITEFTAILKRRKDIGESVFSQLSLAIPFLSVLMLAFAPIVYYGINLLNF